MSTPKWEEAIRHVEKNTPSVSHGAGPCHEHSVVTLHEACCFPENKRDPTPGKNRFDGTRPLSPLRSVNEEGSPEPTVRIHDAKKQEA